MEAAHNRSISLRLRLVAFALLGVTLPAFSQSNNTSSLSCWESKRAGTFQTRQAKTPVSKADAGSAYAQVTAEASTDSGQAQFCKNTAQLFYAKDGNTFKMVYEKRGLDDQGVGMRLLGWSHNSSQLLIEVSSWGYDSDAYVAKSALVLDSSTAQVRELPVDDDFQRLFGKDCEFDFSVVGWQSDDDVLIRVTKTSATAKYQQTFCVEKPTVYALNQQTGTVSLSKGGAESSGTTSNSPPR